MSVGQLSLMKLRRASLIAALGLLAAAPAAAAGPCWPGGQSSDMAEIQNLLGRYGHHADARDDAAFAGLFTGDGVWEAEGLGRFAGTEAIRAFVRGLPGGGRHVTGNYAIDLNGATATARSYVLLIGAESGKPVVRGSGVYEDSLVRIGCEWKIRTRTFRAWKP